MKKSGIFTVQTPFQNTQNNLKDILICTLGYFHGAPLSYTKKRPCGLLLWCAWRDLNPHALALEPKSSVSANSTTGAYVINFFRFAPESMLADTLRGCGFVQRAVRRSARQMRQQRLCRWSERSERCQFHHRRMILIF